MNKTYMSKAIDEAWKYQFLTYPNPAVGACIVKDNIILSCEAHKKAGDSHAEINALKVAYLKIFPNSQLKNINVPSKIHEYLIQNHDNIFNDTNIYITLEPCNHTGKTPSCANILKIVKPKKVYIATLDTNKMASEGSQTLKEANIPFEIGLNEQEAKNLLLPFLLWKKEKFSFFKLAMRYDGSIDDGYITSQDSLNLVHEIRTKIDLLIVGGNTVRVDKPTLDSRFAKSKKAPNILIYSKQKEFNKDIPLFKITNRCVKISNNLNIIKSNFCMYEGGYNLLNYIENNINMLMLFVSHKNKSIQNFNTDKLGFQRIYSYFINEYDEVIFFIIKK